VELHEMDRTDCEIAVDQILSKLGVPTEDQNFTETPRRFVQYLELHFKPPWQVQEEELKLRAATFPSTYKGMVTQKGITVNGICPHHLLPVAYRVSIAYIPRFRVLGLSKLTRLVRLYGELPILQEDATEKIAESFEKVLETLGVGVVMEGRHSCMAIRGVLDPAVTITSAVRGKLREEPTARHEFLSLIGGI
jgi:GTP cyclohydrolase I